MARTLYDILEVSKTAPPEVIKSSYRALAAMYHPDNGPSADEEKFKLIVRAYGVLSDPEKRAEYDSRILHGEEAVFLGIDAPGESQVPKTVKRLDGSDTWCTIDEHIRRKGMELAGTDLKGLSLRNIELKNAQLKGSDLSHAEFDNINLSGADLQQVTCKDGKFYKIDFSAANFDKASFQNCVFSACNFDRCRFKDTSCLSSDFCGSTFLDVKVKRCDFTNSIFEDMRLTSRETVYKCVFDGSNLRKSSFGNSDSKDPFSFKSVSFRRANLEKAECVSVLFDLCDFEEASLTSAQLKYSQIRQPKSLENCNFYNADLSKSTIVDADFTTCNLVNTRFHQADLKTVLFPEGFSTPTARLFPGASDNPKEDIIDEIFDNSSESYLVHKITAVILVTFLIIVLIYASSIE